MTQVAAIAMSLLRGDVLTIMDGFKKFACSNIPREISRAIEDKFGVEVSRDRVDFISQYGHPGFYYRYRLNKTPANEEGIKRMKSYVEQQIGKVEPKTTQQLKEAKQQDLFLNL